MYVYNCFLRFEKLLSGQAVASILGFLGLRKKNKMFNYYVGYIQNLTKAMKFKLFTIFLGLAIFH